MNSENSKTSHPQRLLLNLSDKIELKRSDKYVSLSKNLNNRGMKNLNYLMMFSIRYSRLFLAYYHQKYNTFTDNPPVTLKVKFYFNC